MQCAHEIKNSWNQVHIVISTMITKSVDFTKIFQIPISWELISVFFTHLHNKYMKPIYNTTWRELINFTENCESKFIGFHSLLCLWNFLDGILENAIFHKIVLSKHLPIVSRLIQNLLGAFSANFDLPKVNTAPVFGTSGSSDMFYCTYFSNIPTTHNVLVIVF